MQAVLLWLTIESFKGVAKVWFPVYDYGYSNFLLIITATISKLAKGVRIIEVGLYNILIMYNALLEWLLFSWPRASYDQL